MGLEDVYINTENRNVILWQIYKINMNMIFKQHKETVENYLLHIKTNITEDERAIFVQ